MLLGELEGEGDAEEGAAAAEEEGDGVVVSVGDGDGDGDGDDGVGSAGVGVGVGADSLLLLLLLLSGTEVLSLEPELGSGVGTASPALAAAAVDDGAAAEEFTAVAEGTWTTAAPVETEPVAMMLGLATAVLLAVAGLVATGAVTFEEEEELEAPPLPPPLPPAPLGMQAKDIFVVVVPPWDPYPDGLDRSQAMFTYGQQSLSPMLTMSPET